MWNFNFRLSQSILLSRIFHTISDINSGVIFAQLPVNALFFAAALYQTEHVSFFG